MLTSRVTQIAAPTARLRVPACACCDTVNCSFCTTEAKVGALNTFGDWIASSYGVNLGAKSGHVSAVCGLDIRKSPIPSTSSERVPFRLVLPLN
jgi:hypothetical protein